MLNKYLKQVGVITATLLTASCATTVDKPIPLPTGNWEMATSSFVETGRMPGLPRATLQIRDGHLTMFSGCNTATADVRSADGRMEVGTLATTRRACPEPSGIFEGRLFRMLRDQPYFRTEADMLILAAGDNTARFRRITEKPPAAKP